MPDDATQHVPDAAPARRGPDNRVLIGVAAGLVLMVVVLLGALRLSGGSHEYRVVVPAGTADRIAAGEQIQLIDARIDLAVGDRIVIVNNDDALHQVGPFPVRAGETFDHTFTAPGRFEGLCTLHPDEQVVIVVS